MVKQTAALVLAAGQGKRMRSKTPKVLHTCVGWPLVAHVVALALSRRCDPIVVVIGPEGKPIEETLRAFFPKAPLLFAIQKKPRGTADAARAGLNAIPRHSGSVLVLYGDVPLLRPQALSRLSRAARRSALAIMTAVVPDPSGYGRVVRERGRIVSVVEHRDASRVQRTISEINVGVYLTRAALLRRVVTRVGSANAQQEAYLTDVVGLAAADGGVAGVMVSDPTEIMGVNTRADLAAVEHAWQQRLIAQHQLRGVTFRDPTQVCIDRTVQLGRDVFVGAGVQLLGQVEVAGQVRIEGPTVIRDSTIERGAAIHSFCHLEGARVGTGAQVGPLARLRPGTVLESRAKVGNFVETKKTRLGKKAKANHLAYLGDAQIGAETNVGAGTITCNYDGGPVKHATRTGRGVFIGSNTTLVAPVEVGRGAYVAAGSTITRDVPADALAVGRARQANKEGYAIRLRRRIRGRQS